MSEKKRRLRRPSAASLARFRALRGRDFGQPSAEYLELAHMLDNGRHMPSGHDLYRLHVSGDPLMVWLWARVVDWVLYEQAHGRIVRRNASDDVVSAEYTASARRWYREWQTSKRVTAADARALAVNPEARRAYTPPSQAQNAALHQIVKLLDEYDAMTYTP